MVKPNAEILLQVSGVVQVLATKVGVTHAEVIAAFKASLTKTSDGVAPDGSATPTTDSTSERPALLPAEELGTDLGGVEQSEVTGRPEIDSSHDVTVAGEELAP